MSRSSRFYFYQYLFCVLLSEITAYHARLVPSVQVPAPRRAPLARLVNIKPRSVNRLALFAHLVKPPRFQGNQCALHVQLVPTRKTVSVCNVAWVNMPRTLVWALVTVARWVNSATALATSTALLVQSAIRPLALSKARRASNVHLVPLPVCLACLIVHSAVQATSSLALAPRHAWVVRWARTSMQRAPPRVNRVSAARLPTRRV